MAMFYTGYRRVLKGRNWNDAVHPISGETAKYSNYTIYNTSQVLDGAPREDHEIGTGRHPHDSRLSQMYKGEFPAYPLADPGEGARIDGMRYRPLENKAAGNNLVFKSGYGHIPRENAYSVYNNFTFDGIGTPPLEDPGHAVRAEGAEGTASTFGAFDPWVYKGITGPALDDPGHTVPEGYDNAYGFNKVNEWQGVPSAKALGV
jgi:hypothetical protein